MPTLESVLADALTLSQRERELLVAKLHDSMQPTRHNESDLIAEYDRRLREVETGEAELIDWDVAEKQIFGDLIA